MKPLNRSLLTLSTSAIALMAAGPIIAQEDVGGFFTLEEIVVTATRRATSVTDVPYNISAVSGTQMERANARDMGDVMRMVPGITFIDQGPRASGGTSTITLRGLNLEGGYPSEFPDVGIAPVSIYFGETPLFSNLRMVDMARVEVLRGPQGTLYGSGSLGGTIRFVPNKASTDGFEGKAWADIGTTEASGTGLNYDVGGMVNVVLSDTAALRLVGGYQKQAGFIDIDNRVPIDGSGLPVLADPGDPAFSGFTALPRLKDANDSNQKYIRASLSVDMSDKVAVRALVQYQEDRVDHMQAEGNGADDYTMSSGYLTPADWDTLVANVEVEADLGFATLTSSTSLSDRDGEWTYDSTPVFVGLIPHLYYNYPALSSYSPSSGSVKNFTQEIRLVSNGDGPFSYVLGAFYMKEDMKFDVGQVVPGYDNWASNYLGDFTGWFPGGFADLAPGVWPVNEEFAYFIDRDIAFRDKAIFGELSYQITDDWQVTGGVRAFKQTFRQEFESGLPYVEALGPVWDFDASAYVCPTVCGVLTFDDFEGEDGKDVLFKFNTSYAVNENTNVYFTWSEGFRHGGANVLPFSVLESIGAMENDDATPTKGFLSDKATNIEFGIKGVLNDGTISYTLAAFNVDWDNPQVSAADPFLALPFVANAPKARSRGVEFEVNGMVSANMPFSFGYSYTDGKLTEGGLLSGILDRPVVEGAALPGLSKHMLTGSLDYILVGDNDSETAFHLNAFYRSDFVTAASTGDRGYQELEGFFRADASITYSRDAYSIKAYVSNLTGTKGYSGGGNFPDPWGFTTVTRPRTIGLRLTYNFN